ncbi:MAG: Lysine--tRNA ligase [candidate division WS6 bacterium OLB20]|uniref:Lysine--tRNA ligase n=1 Tax=candidate division WS6 bacterium OLB20 TaxID=1617426 RepID=A0A136M0L3_9BACT|nr:MAG: Lysine--tRNA ligase [candidate division WS6 bacterium OLB20]
MSEYDSSLEGQRKQRIDNLQKLQDLGINPFPSKGAKPQAIKPLVDEFDSRQGKVFTVSGRLMAFRSHGRLAFGDLQDESGRIQLYFKTDTLSALNTEKTAARLGSAATA